MSNNHEPELSIVVPVYNEEAGLKQFHDELLAGIELANIQSYEIIYCDDGSVDNTADVARWLASKSDTVRLIQFSRNFGKENALTAGIAEATGQAILTVDGDGQHPVEILPKFVDAWRNDARVVVGVRIGNGGSPWYKRAGSNLFYTIFRAFTGQALVKGSTDYRLIDKSVQQAFLRLSEGDRITRGLIDWLGFDPVYVKFEANDRVYDAPGYSFGKLIGLAANSFASLTPKPLYMFGYLGVFITLGSLILGAAVLIEQLLLNDPLSWNFTGTAMLAIMLLFLIGIVLMSQGILSLYISQIHNQSKQRPLYIIDYKKSIRVEPESKS